MVCRVLVGLVHCRDTVIFRHQPLLTAVVQFPSFFLIPNDWESADDDASRRVVHMRYLKKKYKD